MDLTPLIDRAAHAGCRVTRDASMAAATTFHIGGPADVLIDLPDAEAAQTMITACRQAKIPWFFMGNGSNLLVSDAGVRGAVLRLDSRAAQPRLLEDHRIWCPAGVSLQRLCRFAAAHSLTGLEFAFGIPGTVGGAVYMNAGAYDGQMADVIEAADCLLPQENTAEIAAVTWDADTLMLRYRHSALMDYPANRQPVVTGVRLRLRPGNQETILARMNELMARRREKQPLEYPSAGSFFKRPEGYFAGALIEQAGFKGYRVGDAQISEKHAGFLVNRGHATAADVLAVCRDVQAGVQERYPVQLEPEVRFVGEF